MRTRQREKARFLVHKNPLFASLALFFAVCALTFYVTSHNPPATGHNLCGVRGGDGLQWVHDCTETTLAICDAGELSRVVAGGDSVRAWQLARAASISTTDEEGGRLSAVPVYLDDQPLQPAMHGLLGFDPIPAG
jgi:hypothetical protein